MRTREIEASLLQSMQRMAVVDAHEHLPPERVRTAAQVDFATLFGHYTHADLKSAGMSAEDYARLQSAELDVDAKWALFEPYWDRIRFGSYARPALMAAKEFYDCDDINASTYRLLSERMAAANTAGLYHRVLREKCNIRVCLTQIGAIPDADRDLLVPLLPVWEWANVGSVTEGIRAGKCNSLEGYLATVREGLEDGKRNGVVGLKMTSGELVDPTRDAAEAAFEAIRDGSLGRDTSALGPFLVHEVLRMAGELGLVVAVHCGIIWDNWNDLYSTYPRYMVPVLLQHRGTRFDLYHAGIPWPREVGDGGGFPERVSEPVLVPHRVATHDSVAPG